MTPTEYKGKTVIHVPTGSNFVVVGGQKRKSGWYLKDELNNLYPAQECNLAEINQLDFDLRKLKAVKDLNALTNLSSMICWDRFHAAWTELEKEPVEAASVAILYCNNWQDFVAMTDGYGVSKNQNASLNQKFRARLREKGLDAVIADWYSRREAA